MNDKFIYRSTQNFKHKNLNIKYIQCERRLRSIYNAKATNSRKEKKEKATNTTFNVTVTKPVVAEVRMCSYIFFLAIFFAIELSCIYYKIFCNAIFLFQDRFYSK